MLIGGFQKCSLVDYPGKIAAIVFTYGCNFRCGYCHNPELVSEEVDLVSVSDVLDFLEDRKGKLDAVCVTGGEPTLQFGLLDFLSKLKKMEYLIKLDTNGSYPDRVRKLVELGLVDFIAMDIKAPIEKYEEFMCSSLDAKKIEESVKFVMGCGIDYEFRTTICKSQISESDVLEIGRLIKGAKKYALQKFVSSKVLDKKFLNEISFSDSEFRELKKKLEDEFVEKCVVR